jgi:hypothetical protein
MKWLHLKSSLKLILREGEWEMELKIVVSHFCMGFYNENIF